MNDLSQQHCEACPLESPCVSDAQRADFMRHIPAWQLVNETEVLKIRREYTFKNFEQALAFTNQVGELAERENHHPDILTQWGKTTVTWWSHNIKGLHKNDFILAARVDALLE